jgi:hypothetical protein
VLAVEKIAKLSWRMEGTVENLDGVASGFEVRREVKKAQGWVRLHDLKLLWIFLEKVAVGQKELHSCVTC